MKNKSDKNIESAVYKSSVEEMLPVLLEAVDAGGSFPFKPSGSSMKPFIRPGIDSVRVVKAEIINKYDIVLYRRNNGQFVLHRIMNISSEGCVMCGDNQWSLETGITKDMILAKVSEIYRKNKKVKCSSKLYMACVHIWCDLFVFRKLYLKVRNRASNLLKRK